MATATSTEFDYLTFRGMKLISFKKNEDGEISGTGILKPLLRNFELSRCYSYKRVPTKNMTISENGKGNV